MKTDGIILDIDGTIWNTTEIVAEAWNKAIEINFPEQNRVTAKILQGQFGKPMNVIADNLFPKLNQEQKDFLIDKCGKMEEEFLQNNTKKITYEGVVDTIKTLSKKVKLFIVSNCQDGYIELVMDKNGITKEITDFECYGHSGFNKDENIKLIVERNHLSAPVYIGDTQGDSEACETAGVPFIWASYGFGKAEKYIEKISKFSDLLKIIDLYN